MLTRFRQKNNRGVLLAEYREYEKLHLISLIATAVIIIGVFITLFFLYSNIYMAINKTREALLADSALSVEIIDFDQYNEVNSAWNAKIQALSATTTLRDPFVVVNTKQNTTSTIPL